MKIAIVTDSTSYLPKEYREQHNITMLPLNIIFENESYQEEVEIEADEFYKKVQQEHLLPKTSQPAIGMVVETFEKLCETHDAIICFSLSSEISGTYQSMIAAASMVDEKKIHVFDSRISCAPEGFFVKEAARMAEEGMTVEEILPKLEAMRDAVRAYFVVDDLDHLQRGGRLSVAQAFVGGLLQVKPILHFEDGKIVPYEKIRTRKRAVKRILEMLSETVSKGGAVEAVIIHGNCLEDAKDLEVHINTDFPNVETSISYFGPVIGTHLGQGSLGLTWRTKTP